MTGEESHASEVAQLVLECARLRRERDRWQRIANDRGQRNADYSLEIQRLQASAADDHEERGGMLEEIADLKQAMIRCSTERLGLVESLERVGGERDRLRDDLDRLRRSLALVERQRDEAVERISEAISKATLRAIARATLAALEEGEDE